MATRPTAADLGNGSPGGAPPPGNYLGEIDGIALSGPTQTCPAFVGYTEVARVGAASRHEMPTLIHSMDEYHRVFGGPPAVRFAVAQPSADAASTQSGGPADVKLVQVTPQFGLYHSLMLYFANGGGACCVVSVGDFSGPVRKTPLLRGLELLRGEAEPTELVVPDAVALPLHECLEVQNAMLEHCAAHGRRFALLDVPGGDRPNFADKRAGIEEFRAGLTSSALQHGAAYYPWLACTVVGTEALDLRNFADGAALAQVLEAAIPGDVEPARRERLVAEIRKVPAVLASGDEQQLTSLHNTLRAVSPLYSQLLQQMRELCNLLPPSAALAGVYCLVDATEGVWRAPANVSLAAVMAPACNLSSQEQDDLIEPADGKTINAIRAFPGKGVLVWGARTLAAHDAEFRYVASRRAANRIAQDAAAGLSYRAFEPNTPVTWAAVHGQMSALLLQMWQQGGLVGATAAEAFEVAVGLASTMTPEDILAGVLRVELRIALQQPGEFLAIAVQQQQVPP